MTTLQRLPELGAARPRPAPGAVLAGLQARPAAVRSALGLSWLTILDSGLTRRCDLDVLGSRELNLRTNPGS